MKKIFLMLIVLCTLANAQYWGEQVTEKSFDNSDLFFESHFLNTYGLYRYKDVAPGLFDNPFLNLYINPASVPDSTYSNLYLYFDFRGDRTEPEIYDYPIFPAYLSSRWFCPMPDPRWLETTREEPEPVFSFGILLKPIPEMTDKLYTSFTYQLIYKNEPFYQIPYIIYNSRYYYDPYGKYRVGLESSLPIEDRYSAADEMNIEAHLLSATVGYQVNQSFALGFGINAVNHSRQGKYLNAENDEWGDTDNSEWENSQSEAKEHNYYHYDGSFSINYRPSSKLTVGAKIGMLSGEADQEYNSGNYYFYRSNVPNVSENWYYSIYDSKTEQKWEHDGASKYIGFNFNRKIDESKTLSGYYRYTATDIDIKNRSFIEDTSYYSSHYISTYDTSWSDYLGVSSMHDNRYSDGKRESSLHEVMFNIAVQLSQKTELRLGIYGRRNESKINSTEPVMVSRYSEYNHQHSQHQWDYDYLHGLIEQKTLQWNYKTLQWSIQLPLILNFRFNDKWGMMLGVNRILDTWKIEEQTLAVFTKREQTENDSTKIETNFGERYTPADEKISEDFTEVIGGFNISVSPAFNIRLLFDPEFKDEFRIAQWWLGFGINL